jgi:uncharacterized membrane protein
MSQVPATHSSTERIQYLADGIFAITMTLLVLELHVPKLELDQSLSHNLHLLYEEVGPKFLAFCVSFVVLAIYWNAHRILFTKVLEGNFIFNWMNLIFLLTVSSIPFSAALLGSYPLEQTAQIIYALNLSLTGIGMYIIVHYAVLSHRLVERERVSQEFRLNVTGKFLLPAISYILAIVSSFYDTRLSMAFLVLAPLIYFIPIDSRLWAVLSGAKWKLR